MTNVERCNQLATRIRAPKFKLGELVREPHGQLGRVDAIFADYQAALDGRSVPKGWYEGLAKKPKTPKEGCWYCVVLTPAGAVLVGEDDLEHVTS